MKKTLLQRHCIHWIVFLYCSVFANLCSAQLNRHWAQLFNEEASLVAGSVVGGGAASSSIYYNPASISEFTDNRLAVNASLFTLQYYQATNALGDEYDLTDFEFDVYPRFVAYIIESKKHPRRKMEVAILTKNNTNFRFEDYIQQKVDVNSSLPGAENHITGFSNRQRFNETWAGLGSSHEINNTFSIGWSIFGIYKFMEYRNSQNIKVIPETDSVRINGNWVPTYVSEITEAEWFRINNYRALLKVGGLWNFDRWSLGWNLTSPSLLVFSGASEASFERTATNIRTETGALPQSSSYIEYQDNMHSDFKDPGSVAIGVTFKGDDANSVLSVSAEYFFELETYKLLDASGSNGVSSNEILSNAGAAEPLTYVHGAKPVLVQGHHFCLEDGWDQTERSKVRTFCPS